MVTRIVLHSLKRLDDVPRTVRVLRGMDGRIPGLRAVEVGAAAQPAEKGPHIAVTTLHDDWESLALYDRHPVQQRVQLHLKRVEDRAVRVEYEV